MATFAEKMLAKIEERMLALGGVEEATVNGERLKLRDLKKEREYYRRELARERGLRPTIVPLDLSGS